MKSPKAIKLGLFKNPGLTAKKTKPSKTDWVGLFVERFVSSRGLMRCDHYADVEHGCGDDGDVVDGVVLRHCDHSTGDCRLRPRGHVPAGLSLPQRRADCSRLLLAAILPLSHRSTHHRRGASLGASFMTPGLPVPALITLVTRCLMFYC